MTFAVMCEGSGQDLNFDAGARWLWEMIIRNWSSLRICWSAAPLASEMSTRIMLFAPVRLWYRRCNAFDYSHESKWTIGRMSVRMMAGFRSRNVEHCRCFLSRHLTRLRPMAGTQNCVRKWFSFKGDLLKIQGFFLTVYSGHWIILCKSAR